MNDLAKYKMYFAAASAAVVAALGVLGYTEAAHCVTAISGALFAALGLNAIGAGLGARQDTGGGK